MIKQLELDLGDHQIVTGEYVAGNKLVIFSHGFDVRRDSNGLFHDIAHNLPAGYGYIIFDYHHYDGEHEYLRPLSEQAAALKRVVEWAKQELKPENLNLIAHSMGCTVASLAAIPSFDKVIYLAPPLINRGGMRRYLSTHPNADHSGDHLKIKRRSGKITHVIEQLFIESESTEPGELIKSYAYSRPISLIYASEDKFINEETYLELAKTSKIAVIGIEADHNFTGAARNKLIKQICVELADD